MPSMHDMIDELNDMDCPSFSASEPVGNNFLTTGCGFGSWIWILLILFYAGQGGCGGYAGNTGYGCGCNTSSNCCCGGNTSNNGFFGGLGNCGGGYLFLLVILFLCNGSFGCGNNALPYAGLV